jgi:hypothetical protein
MANELAEQHTQRHVAAARAAANTPDPVLGDCEACCDDNVMVKTCGGLLRCVDCRTKCERRK